MKHEIVIMISVCIIAFGCASRNVMNNETSASTTNPVQQEAELSKRKEHDVSVDMVRCECTILEVDFEYLYCDYDDVSEGSDSSLGSYPWLRVKISFPEEFEGKEFEIIFESGISKTNLKLIEEKNENCSIDLPKDFLEGKFSRIDDSSIENFLVKKAP